MKKENNKKKVLAFSIVFFISLLCIEYTYVCYRQYSCDRQEYEKVLTVYDIDDYQGYSLENGMFKPESDDSRVIIGDCGDIISNVTLNFKEPMEEDTDVSLYYSKKSNGKGANYCKKLVRAGNNQIEFKFRAQMYRYISLKIDGEFSLDSIDIKLNKGEVSSKTERNIFIVFICIDTALFFILEVLNKNTLVRIIKKDGNENYISIKASSNESKFTTEKIFLIWALIGGVLISVLVPPAQVPDEYTHISMMQEEIGLKGYAEEINNKYLEEIGSSRIINRNGEKQDLIQYLKKSKVKFSDDLHITIRLSIKIVRHFVADIAFLLCIIIGIPIFWCLQISELFSLVFYVILGYYAIKLMPVKKELLAVIMLLPMSLQQAGSLNYDATLIPVCCLFIAYVVHLLYSEEKIGWKKLGFILFLLAVMAIIKPPYVLLAVLMFMIPVKQYELKIKEFNIVQAAYRFRWRLLVLCCISALTGVYLLRSNVNVIMVIASIAKLPKYILIMLRTIKNSLAFYGVSAIGYFGWLDSRVGIWYVAVTIIVCIVLTQVDDKKDNKFNIKRSVLCIISFLMVFNLIFIAMESWTVFINNQTVDNNLGAWLNCLDQMNIIEGVQGRYLIPIIPVVGMLIPAVKKVRKEHASLILNSYAIISIVHVGLVLVNRYWVGVVY